MDAINRSDEADVSNIAFFDFKINFERKFFSIKWYTNIDIKNVMSTAKKFTCHFSKNGRNRSLEKIISGKCSKYNGYDILPIYTSTGFDKICPVTSFSFAIRIITAVARITGIVKLEGYGVSSVKYMQKIINEAISSITSHEGKLSLNFFTSEGL
tara:strand:+ start:1128 stop:1592 length:465 start_codon:yes stop_codon:yes gene_type:complete